MRDNIFATHSLDMHPRSDAAEPEFGWRTAPEHLKPNSDAENERRIPTVPPTSRPIDSLLYLVLAGLVAIATVGIFFGAGLHLLAPPTKEKLTHSSAHDGTPSLALGNALRANIATPPISQELAVPKSSELAALPASPAAQPAEVADAPLANQEASAAPIKDLPEQTAAVAATASSPTTSPAQPTSSAGLPRSPTQDAAPSDSGKRHPTRSGISHATRSASRQAHSRPAHGSPSLTPPQAGRTRSFDRLVTQLTGQAQTDVPTLTPPQKGQPDPFTSQRPTQ